MDEIMLAFGILTSHPAAALPPFSEITVALPLIRMLPGCVRVMESVIT